MCRVSGTHTRVYISHGRTDTVLPIEQTTRRIVPRLQAEKIPTEVHEFDAGHIAPHRCARHGAAFGVRRPASRCTPSQHV